MFLTEDISKFLRTESPAKIILFLRSGVNADISTIQDKLNLAKAWVAAGRPSDTLPALVSFLGDNYEAYTHYVVDRLYVTPLNKILKSEFEYLDKLPKGIEPILKEILNEKLGEKLEFEGITALEGERSIELDTPDHKIISFSLKSKYSGFYVMKIMLEFEGFNYKCKSLFLSDGDYILPSEESMKKIKKTMYEMSESGNWRLDYIDKVVGQLKFNNPVFDCFLENVISYSNTLRKQ